jgi:RNA recognition motif-containing protein
VLTDILSHFGVVKDVDMITYPRSKKLKGVAYVHLSTEEEVKSALECLAPKRAEKLRRQKNEESKKEKEEEEDNKKEEETKEQHLTTAAAAAGGSSTWIDGREIDVDMVSERYFED